MINSRLATLAVISCLLMMGGQSMAGTGTVAKSLPNTKTSLYGTSQTPVPSKSIRLEIPTEIPKISCEANAPLMATKIIPFALCQKIVQCNGQEGANFDDCYTALRRDSGPNDFSDPGKQIWDQLGLPENEYTAKTIDAAITSGAITVNMKSLCDCQAQLQNLDCSVVGGTGGAWNTDSYGVAENVFWKLNNPDVCSSVLTKK